MIKIISKKFVIKFGSQLDHTLEHEIVKCKMISKHYINHNTFIAEYQPENKQIINITTAMHVSIMYFIK